MQMTSTTVRGDDAALAMDVLRRIVRALRVFTHATEREFGVSAAQFFVLRQLAARPGQSLGELASRTRTSPSSVSEVAAALVKRGLVVRGRADDDHRRAEFRLTSEGSELLGHAPVSVQEQLVAGFERLPPEEQRVLREGMEAWLEASGLSDVPATMFFEGVEGPSRNEP